jgi:hypothetical protein
MTAESGKEQEKTRPSNDDDEAAATLGTGTEAKRMGGIEPAKRQAEKDWDESAKEDGD